MRPLYRPLTLAAAVAALLFAGSAARAQESLLVLGDSYAFGYTTSTATPKNTGDNGYVSLFADYLDAQNGAAARPNVLSLARPGETFPTFANFQSGTAGPNGNGLYNTRYEVANSPTQIGLLTSTLSAPPAPIRNVVIQLGGNDILGLLTQPSWYSNATTDAQRFAAITAAVDEVRGGMQNLAGQVRSILPDANIYIVGYGDPFQGLTGSELINNGVVQFLRPGATYGDFVKPFTAQGTLQSVAAYQSVAAAVAGLPGTGTVQFVDIAPTIAGNEAGLTLIGSEEANGVRNFHPSAAGYQAIGNRIVATASAAAVPEAGTAGLLAAGSGGGVLLLAVARRRRRAASVPAV